jgi:hypothetical protein
VDEDEDGGYHGREAPFVRGVRGIREAARAVAQVFVFVGFGVVAVAVVEVEVDGVVGFAGDGEVVARGAWI